MGFEGLHATPLWFMPRVFVSVADPTDTSPALVKRMSVQLSISRTITSIFGCRPQVQFLKWLSVSVSGATRCFFIVSDT